MRSFIKIYGPPLLKAIKALEKIAIDVPKVCMMNTRISDAIPSSIDFRETESVMSYFQPLGDITITRCESIISKSGEMLGQYDFFFEWLTEPTMDQLNDLVEKIDEALAPLGCRYTITTKK